MTESEDKIPVSKDDWVTLQAYKVTSKAFKIVIAIVAPIIVVLTYFGFDVINDTKLKLNLAQIEIDSLKNEINEKTLELKEIVKVQEKKIKDIDKLPAQYREIYQNYFNMLSETYSNNISDLITAGIDIKTVKRSLDTSFEIFNEKNKIISKNLEDSRKIIQNKLEEINFFKDSVKDDNVKFREEFNSEIIGLSERTPIQISVLANISIQSATIHRDKYIKKFEVSDIKTNSILVPERTVSKGEKISITKSDGSKYSLEILEVIETNVPFVNDYAIIKITKILKD